jgi:hypothetical protein
VAAERDAATAGTNSLTACALWGSVPGVA